MSTIVRVLRSARDSSEFSVSVSRCCDAVRWVITVTTRTRKNRG